MTRETATETMPASRAATAPIASPQAPRNRAIRLSGPLPFPGIEPLSLLALQSKSTEIFLRTTLESTMASLGHLCDRLPEAARLAASFPGLADELAPYLDGAVLTDHQWAVAKIRTEFSVYTRLRERVTPVAGTSRAAFVDLLLEVHRRLGKGAGSFRNGPVMVRPDRAGNKIMFPHHAEVPALVGRLHDFLCRHAAAYPVLSATIIYAAIIHAHPFADGNGRTARTMYNLLLAAEARTRHFVPIHMISMLDRSSFLIKLRRALYVGDWTGLQAFFSDACRMSDLLQREDVEDGARAAAPAGPAAVAFTGGEEPIR